MFELFNVVFVCSQTGIRHYHAGIHQLMIDRMLTDFDGMGWYTMKPYKMQG